MNVAPGAWKYAILPLLAAPFALVFSVTASVVALAAAVATLAFFRDPDRTPPPTGVVSPADGTVSVLREEGERVRLGVFMNVWHVHVVRAPVSGRVTDVEHVSGANRPAFSKESDRNERVHVRLETDSPTLPAPAASDAADDPSVATDDSTAAADPNAADSNTDDDRSAADDPSTTDGRTQQATVTLVAGAFARRIFPYVDPGDELERGDRIGHIAFGSRVDVLFPPSVDGGNVAVAPGDSATAGETVILESPIQEFPIDVAFGTGDAPGPANGENAEEFDDGAPSGAA